MPNRNPVIFKRSLLAVAIVSLSACSTTPRIQDYDLSRVGDGILKAGRTTADVSERVWDRTTYLLGFSDGDTVSDENLLMDEVDLAMSQEDAVMPADLEIRPVSVPQAIANPAEDTLQSLDGIELDNVELAQSDSVPALPDALELDSESLVAVEDLVHEVASAETLWDIAKKTTGDANNWHVLADVNNLSPNASVFPGQQLIIPSDMVKPGYLDTPDEAVQQADAEILIDTQNIAANTATAASDQVELLATAATDAVESGQRLAIPDADSSEPVTELVALNDTAIELGAGETLWDFAKRTTGDATNWQAIASHNNFTDKQAVVVRAGQSIRVPEQLLKPDFADEGTVQIEAPEVAAAEPVVVEPEAEALTAPAETISIADETAVEASSELLAEASTLDETQPLADETTPIKIVEATFKTDTNLLPETLEQPAQAVDTTAMTDVAHGEIMVSGTYYPKAIYNDADFSSSLLMRVSPGTTLQVSKAMGNWFEVETDKGVGYVHQRDIK